MTKYIIKFRPFKNENFEEFNFYDNDNNKTIRDAKEFINCYNNLICPCMLIAPKKNHFFNFGKDNYKDDTKLNLFSNDLIVFIEQKLEKCVCMNSLENNKKYLSLPKKSLIDKINELTHKEYNYLNNNINLYDIIIKINSLINLKAGWKIIMTEKGKKLFNELKNKEFGIIGIIGNINKGKKFLVSKLTGINISNEINIDNNGLYLKYFNSDNNLFKKYIFLSSKGSDQPILENGIKYEENIATNLFLQDFIIIHSDIIILVIDYLAFSEQRMIDKIKNKINSKKNETKLIIIHNLKMLREINNVKDYINNILLKSCNFELKRKEIFSSKKSGESSVEYYKEQNEKNLSVFHLILAQEKSKAGLYFNEFTINFIKILYNDIINVKKFDIIENLISNFCLLSRIYLNQIIEKDDFILKEEIIKEKLIRLKVSKELKLKKILFENLDLGFQLFLENNFEPKYSINKKDDKLIIEVELPGNKKVEVSRPQFIGDKTIIIIKGKKMRDKDPKERKDNILDIRNYGDFEIKISIDTEKYQIHPDNKIHKFIEGVLYLEYQLEEENNEKTIFKLEEEI